jgi:two-component system sensor histidine kinase PilS (NtrC family)
MAARAGGVGAAGADGRIQARLARLMAARLVLSVALFAAALLLQLGRGGVAWEASHEGLYATLAFAFLSTVVLAACLGRIRHPGTFGAIQIPTDAAIVTALVHFTGGDESLFSFLYVLVVVFGAMVARRGGAFGAAALCAGLHGALLAAEHGGWLPDHGSAPGGDVSLALLGSHLTRELATADAELDASRSDLELLRSLHRRIVDSLLSGLLTTDENGRITSFNPEAERITGYGAAEAWGLDIDDVIPGSGAAVVSPALAGEEPSKLRLRLTYSNRRAEELHLGLAGSLLRDAGGRPRGSVVIFQDVTRVVQMERELRRSERLAATGRLAGDIAHEVRNPLAAISGSIQMLLDSDAEAPSPEGARLMEIVLRETDRLNTLISDFLQYAHPRPPKLEAMPLDLLLDDVGRMGCFGTSASTPSRPCPRAEPWCCERGPGRQALKTNAATAETTRRWRRLPGWRSASRTPGWESSPRTASGSSIRSSRPRKKGRAWAWPRCIASWRVTEASFAWKAFVGRAPPSGSCCPRRRRHRERAVAHPGRR